MPYGFLRELRAFQAEEPALRRWSVSIENDNGIIEQVWASPGE